MSSAETPVAVSTGLSISPSTTSLLSTSPSGVSLAKSLPVPPRPSTTPIKGQMSRRLTSESNPSSPNGSSSVKQPKPTPASKSVQDLVTQFELRASPSKDEVSGGRPTASPLKRSVSGLASSLNGNGTRVAGNGDAAKATAPAAVTTSTTSSSSDHPSAPSPVTSPSPQTSGLPAAPLVSVFTKSTPEVSTASEEPTTKGAKPIETEPKSADAAVAVISESATSTSTDASATHDSSNAPTSETPTTPPAAPSTAVAPVSTESTNSTSPSPAVSSAIPAAPSPSVPDATPSEAPSDAPSLASGPHPLNSAYCLFFQDTSPTKKASSTAEDTHNAYSHGQKLIFTVQTVEEFCSSWNALRSYIRTVVNSNDGLVGLKHDSNLNFFREGVKPMWEDPMNAKGGRLTIACQKGQIDVMYTQIVLLLVGSVVEIDSCPTTSSGGTICGAVASRRGRGDRIELWLGGETTPDANWITRVKDVLATQLNMPEIRDVKYRKHF
ncbi:protein ife-isoform a [Phaffia rhodozyma]|uniref:Protein ife-isoform a n=1 Tax=Phaffia rhodozyma TaxID=264483 RepID=A0A0F7SXM5_PHARH|nr:protein ife-isoform a [Phaffia rhodozyma]